MFFSGDDSWGEEESDEEDYPSYPHLPYAYPGSRLPMPVVMYPMILPPQPVPRKSKGTIMLTQVSVLIFLKSSSGRIPAGAAFIDLNRLSNESSRTEISIEKCPDKNASIEASLHYDVINEFEISERPSMKLVRSSI